MSERRSTKREKMLLDEDVRRWYDNLSRRSRITAEVNLRRLSLFCELHGLSARGLVEMAKGNRMNVEDLVLDFVTRTEESGKSPGYITGLVKAIRSWLKYNDIELKRTIRISNAGTTPSIEDERIPTQEELKTMLMYASERAKVSVALMAYAGLRPQSLGNESGKDGLTLKDLPEMKVEGNRVRFEKIPTRVIVRLLLSKARHRYFTFLPKEGCEYLAAYLEKRIAKGEELVAASPVIAVVPGYERMGKSQRNAGSKFITTRNVTREIREAIRPRFAWRPYVFRAYFDSQMLLAENHGKITSAYRTFFMGHKGDIEARYTTHKGALPVHMIEDMRAAYERSQEFLQTAQTAETSEERLAQAFRKQLLLVAGFAQPEIDKMDTHTMTDEQLQEIVRKKLLGTHTNNEAKQKVVSVDEANDYLTQGWEYVAKISSNRVVIKMNSASS